jgi:hypothetical protein
MLEMLRRNFFFALLKSSDKIPVTYHRDELDLSVTIEQRGGFKVRFKDEEVERWMWR